MAWTLRNYYVIYRGFTFVVEARNKVYAHKEFIAAGYVVRYPEIEELIGPITEEMVVLKPREL